jgi:hypothetical protein
MDTASLGKKYLPLPWQQFFHDQRAAPNPETDDGGMWFGDELPPTYQDFLNSPRVRQAQMMSTLQLLQQISQSEQQAVARLGPAAQKRYAKEVAKRMAQQQQPASNS